MRALPRRLIALFALSSFAPLVIGGPGWHFLTEHHACDAPGHAHESAAISAADAACQAGHGGACTDHTHAGCQHGHVAASAEQLKRERLLPAIGFPQHDHSQCAVCRFLAQPQQPATVTFVEVVEFACADVPARNSGVPHATVPLRYRSRAPPPAARSA